MGVGGAVVRGGWAVDQGGGARMRRSSLILFALPAGVFPPFLIGGDAVQAGGPPGYEQAFVLGKTVTINAIEVPNVANDRALADFYQVVYPIDWASRGLNPQCQPCDHDGQGIDFIDFHDHVLDSMPSSPGHGEFSPLWKVFLVIPAYDFITGSSTTHSNLDVSNAFAAVLPATSETAVDALLAERLPDGAPVAACGGTHHSFSPAALGPAGWGVASSPRPTPARRFRFRVARPCCRNTVS